VLVVEVVERSTWDVEGRPSIAFDRVSGWSLGVANDWWRRDDIRSDPTGRIFTELRYAFGSDRWRHRYGAEAQWFVRGRYDVTATALRQRWLATHDAEAMPNGAEQVFMAAAYAGDYRDYYERLGSELTVRVATDDERDVLTTRVVAERHASMDTASRWSLFSPHGGSEANMPATPGRLRALSARYDRDRTSSGKFTEGWAHTFSLEQSLPALGSDFAFTRVESHTRGFIRLGNNYVNARLRLVLTGGAPPLQRLAIWGGSGSLRGYGRHELVGANGWLTTVEYRHHLFAGSFGLVFADAAGVWGSDVRDPMTGVHASLGYGILLENVLRVRVARALRSNAKARWHVRWARTF
jgi:outer membrane protein assembly factor BamA